MILKIKIAGLSLSTEDKKAILNLINTLEDKHFNRNNTGIKSTRPHPTPGVEIEQLLYGRDEHSKQQPKRKQGMGVVTEEDRHGWIKSKTAVLHNISDTVDAPAPPAPKIYMRVWDDKSQARIREGTEGFLSGSNYQPLDTKQSRRTALENHANWKNRVKTVFISATTDFKEIVDHQVPHLEKRQKNNGLGSVTKITLINGNADGMPILSMRKELDFYKCHIPYQNSPSRLEYLRNKGLIVKETYRESLFANEHIFLFRVTANQVIKTWLWKDIQKWLQDNNTDDTQRW
jgi:hypothetical protein